jgi:hypothetical protein
MVIIIVFLFWFLSSFFLYLGKAILTTIEENKNLLFELFQARPTAFQPSIPNLVYQYNLFTNYPATTFSSPNPEIPL